MTTMQIDSKMQDVISKDMNRYVINSFVVTPYDDENAFAWGTDGKVLAVRRVAACGLDDEVQVPPDILVGAKSGRISCDGKTWRQDVKAKPKVLDVVESGRPPKAQDILPDLSDAPLEEEYKLVALDGKLIAALASALSPAPSKSDPTGVTLAIPKDSTKAVLAVSDDGKAIGMIMPRTQKPNFKDSWTEIRDEFRAARDNAKDE